MITVELNGPWQMRQATDSLWQQARVPGSVYADLLAAGSIEDPFFRDNELQVKKLSENDYEYTREFHGSADLLQSDRINLCCEGLDTLAEIFINGQSVATTDNMHRRYEFAVKELLVEGSNRIRIIFRSPVGYITRKNQERPLWNPDTAIPGIAHLRKAHYMFGWDWGPTLPDMGIWRSIYITALSKARLADVYVVQNHQQDAVALDVRVRIEQLQNARSDLEVVLLAPDGREFVQTISGVGGEAHLLFEVGDPERWWPNGYGDQPLYQVHTRLRIDGELLDERSLKIGLRTLTVRQDEDEWGKGFAFEINGVSIFSMGADYIPEDSILSRRSREKTERLISDCATANFNSIRIWGGGTYPEDYFYDLCDQYGLIVWQDFMFACAAYEMTDAFTENIKSEVADNARRLRHHPSLGLWCGNNEMEWGWVEWAFSSEEKLKADYLLQFEKVIPEVLQEIDPNTFYWPASPSSGGGFDRPNDENIGDVHDWMVWHGRKPFTYYRAHYYRFLSEFGLQSFPGIQAVHSFSLPEERNIFSRIMEHHQKNGTGNETILYYIAQTFKYPGSLDSLIYASQLVQAEGMRYAVEHMRRHRGRCMGSIYWQLNDCWPVASWSSIDSLGQWKALHYVAKRFYQPVLLSACESAFGATLHLTNDTLHPVTGRVAWKLRDTCSNILSEGSKAVAADALTAQQCEVLKFSDLETNADKQRNVYLEYTFTVDEVLVCSDAVIFVKPKYFEFRDPEIECQVKEVADAFQLILTSKAFAQHVEVTLDGPIAVFSDNCFHLSAGEPRCITLDKKQLAEITSPETLRRRVSIRTVYDIEARET